MLQLTNLSVQEKAGIKSDAIIALSVLGQTTIDSTKIEIVGLEKITGGIQVFVRAWEGKQQYGFGADGSVDVERFRIYNPPVLVPDPNGTVQRYSQNIDNCIVGSVVSYREDPQIALGQVITSIVKKVGKLGTTIQVGKVGNTTDTFYSAAGNTTPIDGLVQRSLAAETWTQTRDSTGNLVNTTGDLQIGQGEFCAVCGSRYIITRNVLLFDTSPLPDADTITSATLSLWTLSGANRDTTNGDTSNIISCVTAATNALANGDYNKTNWGTTAFAAGISVASLTNDGYSDFALNSSGIANISKTGISYFGERSGNDLNNVTPTLRGYCIARSADTTGTTNDPMLVVVHNASLISSSNFLLMGVG